MDNDDEPELIRRARARRATGSKINSPLAGLVAYSSTAALIGFFCVVVYFAIPTKEDFNPNNTIPLLSRIKIGIMASVCWATPAFFVCGAIGALVWSMTRRR